MIALDCNALLGQRLRSWQLIHLVNRTMQKESMRLKKDKNAQAGDRTQDLRVISTTL